MKSCETCKHRGDPINIDKNMYWCECGKNCVNGSAWESKAHPTEKGGVTDNNVGCKTEKGGAEE